METKRKKSERSRTEGMDMSQGKRSLSVQEETHLLNAFSSKVMLLFSCLVFSTASCEKTDTILSYVYF